eukprot:gb/GECH01003611.1/.p1 GENE.gb/GECH01003611.1/~~gb/GECH01003611.1/.p1  ORF type:complete len:301 (+),score=82.64 gb/GECH01003611.1/:1-903(+)
MTIPSALKDVEKTSIQNYAKTTRHVLSTQIDTSLSQNTHYSNIPAVLLLNSLSYHLCSIERFALEDCLSSSPNDRKSCEQARAAHWGCTRSYALLTPLRRCIEQRRQRGTLRDDDELWMECMFEDDDVSTREQQLDEELQHARERHAKLVQFHLRQAIQEDRANKGDEKEKDGMRTLFDVNQYSDLDHDDVRSRIQDIQQDRCEFPFQAVTRCLLKENNDDFHDECLKKMFAADACGLAHFCTSSLESCLQYAPDQEDDGRDGKGEAVMRTSRSAEYCFQHDPDVSSCASKLGWRNFFIL